MNESQIFQDCLYILLSGLMKNTSVLSLSLKGDLFITHSVQISGFSCSHLLPILGLGEVSIFLEAWGLEPVSANMAENLEKQTAWICRLDHAVPPNDTKPPVSPPGRQNDTFTIIYLLFFLLHKSFPRTINGR